jgi:hypothetical protein
MRTMPLLLVGSLALLAGCGDGRSAAPVSSTAPVPVALPVDLLGTWTAQDGSGFIALGARQVVVAVDGAPRIVAMPIQNAIEPGMSAGMIGLAGGAALFLARGTTPVNGVPVDHLDIEIVGADGKAVRRRLLAESGLRMAARMAPAAAPATPSARTPEVVAVVPKPADPDADFLAGVSPARRNLAEHCIARAHAGDPPVVLSTDFGNRQRLTFSAVLTLMEQARNLPPAQAADRYAEADRKRSDAEAFAQAWRRWMAGRG